MNMPGPYSGRPPDDFGTRPFMLGSVVGERAFKVGRRRNDRIAGGYENQLILLPNIGVPHVWTPGVNTALCLAGVNAHDLTGDLNNPLKSSTKNVAIPKEVHEIAMKECSCGFYAYYNGSNQYANGIVIRGIIEAWGKGVVGARGFRMEKAQILALEIPDTPKWTKIIRQQWPLQPDTFVRQDWTFQEVMQSYSEIPWFNSLEEAEEEFPLTDYSEYALEQLPELEQ